ncbi:uncharacterized protein LOC129757108 [Uranotaenia lowii]|uniref:uncharacterized protein LOC129757108 n=1 Tax=Uranotaenia lowii TaxID=190385 RepID=UPI00247AC269|nr:uncharacterized protein LOC129757108 [Uranotaenia lowii]
MNQGPGIVAIIRTLCLAIFATQLLVLPLMLIVSEAEANDAGILKSDQASATTPTKGKTATTATVKAKSKAVQPTTTTIKPKTTVKTTKKPKENIMITVKGTIDEDLSDLDSFDDADDFGDIWGDVEKPPATFGREFDLKPNQISPECIPDDSFLPVLELPEDLVPEMFYRSPTNGTGPAQAEKSTGSEEDPGLIKSLISSITSALSLEGLKNLLESVRKQLQLLTDRFKVKTAESLQSIRTTMDQASNSIKKVITTPDENWDKSNCNEKVKECIEKVNKEFKTFENNLRNEIKLCTDRFKGAVNERKSKIEEINKSTEQTLGDLTSCLNNPPPSVTSILSSLLKTGKCTVNQVSSRTSSTLKDFSSKVLSQEAALSSKTEQANQCIEEKVTGSKIKTKQNNLMDQYQKCLRI